ncbi:MAG: hypothetical protein U5R14_02905 [Gemmatimonadota bacterium]|nr:hypothetical protein [Gemmatimonadota bacterium]
MFVSLRDNVPPDRDDTVLRRVVAGMKAVDAVLPGDVTVRAEIRPRH